MADCSTCNQESTCSKKTCAVDENKHSSSNVKHILGIMSGKGGVGKSSVTSMLAVSLQRQGYKVGILDADITGPSIPKIFGVKNKPLPAHPGMYPASSTTGISIMSINLLLENETKPVIWRGPVISGTVKQFWTDVAWGDLDYLLIDMPLELGMCPLL